MQIDASIIDQIKDRVDIVELIGKQLKLKRSGGNYFANCPFHKEKSASFSINSVKQYYHCFGCGASGNAITFIMHYDGVDFVEAVQRLASKVGIVIPTTNMVKLTKAQVQEQKQHKHDLESTIMRAVKFYQSNLANSSLATNYLLDRGLSSSVIDKFMLGFIAHNKALSNIFGDYVNNEFLVEAGLVIKSDDGRTYDRFRERVIFPIRSSQGQVIAFGGRIITNGEPKYLNSPETKLFNKSKELYGLYEANKAIREAKYALVVEGYMDVISLHQYGVNNAVASMGTAVSVEHIQKLFKLANDIYFCFDGDRAGHLAAWRSLDRSIDIVSDSQAVHFMFLDKEHDPDSFIREFGQEAFINKLRQESLPLSVFLLKQLSLEVNLVTDEGKAKLISLVKPFLERFRATALQVMLKKSLAKYVELDASSLESILNNRSKYAFYNTKWRTASISNSIKLPQPNLNLVEVATHYALHNIAMVHSYKLPDLLDNYDQATRELVLLLDYISYSYTNTETVDLELLLNEIEFQVIDVKKAYNKSIVGENPTMEDFHKCLDKVFALSKVKVTKIPRIPMRKL